jgi:hypothetical protein
MRSGSYRIADCRSSEPSRFQDTPVDPEALFAASRLAAMGFQASPQHQRIACASAACGVLGQNAPRGTVARLPRSEFILIDRTMAGLAQARAQGKRLGRPATSDETISRARVLRTAGVSMDRIAHELGFGKSVAQLVCQGVAA